MDKGGFSEVKYYYLFLIYSLWEGKGRRQKQQLFAKPAFYAIFAHHMPFLCSVETLYLYEEKIQPKTKAIKKDQIPVARRPAWSDL